jgi:hypothetical protein
MEDESPSWLTVKVWPAMVIVPVRWVDSGFAATEYATDPLPSPGDPEVTRIQASLLAAVHWHPAVVMTETEPAPPSEFTLVDVGLIE